MLYTLSVSMLRLKSSKKKSPAAADHQVEAKVASHDKRR